MYIEMRGLQARIISNHDHCVNFTTLVLPLLLVYLNHFLIRQFYFSENLNSGGAVPVQVLHVSAYTEVLAERLIEGLSDNVLQLVRWRFCLGPDTCRGRGARESHCTSVRYVWPSERKLKSEPQELLTVIETR